MKKRWLPLILMFIMLCSLLTGCGGDSGSAVESVGMSNGAAFNAGMDSYVPSDSKDSGSGDSSYVEEARSDVKRIYTGNVSLETVRFDDVMTVIDSMVEDAGGYFEDHEVYTRNDTWNDSGMYRYADLTIRVPVEQFDSVMNSIVTAESVSVVSQSVSSDDVSEQYYDIEIRLENARDQVEQLQALLEQAETVDEVISVRNALSDATYDLEYLQGQLNRYDSRIQYSYLYVTVREVTALTMTARAAGFGAKLSEGVVHGFTSGIEFLADLLLVIVSNWLVILVLVLVIILIVRASRKRIRKHTSVKREKRASRKAEREAQMKELEELRRTVSEKKDENVDDESMKS